jgi:hypothetical protein
MNALPDVKADPRALHVYKRPDSLKVVFATADGVCETLEGPVWYCAGDAILTGIRGEKWPVKRDLFLASYEPVPPTVAEDDGIYCKLLSEALALRLDRPVLVPVGWQDDPLQGRLGDWLLRYADGSYGVVQDEIFRKSYQPAEGETRWPPGR